MNCNDIRGAIRVISTEDKFNKPSEDSYQALKKKHPEPHEDTSAPTPPDQDMPQFHTTQDEVRKKILSFRSGAAGGLDGLTPQHLKDLTAKNLNGSKELLGALAEFYNKIVFSGKIPDFVCPTYYGARLMGLSKKEGGIRPIAIGVTLRRLGGKISMGKLQQLCQNTFKPNQLGVCTRAGCEIAVHSLRRFAEREDASENIICKIDYHNAFNCVRRDVFLRNVRQEVPALYRQAYQAYGAPSELYYHGDISNNVISSAEGVQQGDPLGPFLFSLAIQGLIRTMKSPANLWYLDDGCIAGPPDAVLADLQRIQAATTELGLSLNSDKCELCFLGQPDRGVLNQFRKSAPLIKEVDKSCLTLLGAPIFPEAARQVLDPKLKELRLMSSRLEKLDSHTAVFLLRNAFALPKMTYFLRAAPCFTNTDILEEYDSILHNALESIINIRLDNDTWMQASLPISCGGLGIRRASDISLPAYLSSVSATFSAVCSILSEEFSESNFCSYFVQARNLWCQEMKSDDADPTFPEQPGVQQKWDLPLATKKLDYLITNAPSQEKRAILQAVSSEHSSEWLSAIPSSNLGLKLNNTCLRIAVCLRLGCKIAHPYTCTCGAAVDTLAHHPLACRVSEGRHPRHSAINATIKRAFGSADIPSSLEPSGITRNDFRRPDGVTHFPFSNGKCVVWDFTCVDTVCVSNLPLSINGPGKAAERAEERKRRHYNDLTTDYAFQPIALETFGSWAPGSLKFIKSIGEQIKLATDEPRSTYYLLQRISIILQRSNAASIIESLGPKTDLKEVFEL